MGDLIGRWVQTDLKQVPADKAWWRCSCCNAPALNGRQTIYCPNCGARLIQPCEECKHYDDIDCTFCRGEYMDRWEAKE